MMFTCSALRCSVFEGSAISGASRGSGADDPTAPAGIPDAVLYVTVDDPALADVVRNLEHPADLRLDAPRDIGPRGGREFDPLEVLRSHDFEQAGVAAPFRIRGEKAVDIGREDRALRSKRPRELEHHHVPGANGDATAEVSHDIPERHRRKAYR